MEKHLDYSKDVQYHGISAPYFKAIINSVLNMMPHYNERYSATVLDFGAGYGYIKRLMKHIHPNWKVINYDILPECSDVKDYTELKNNKSGEYDRAVDVIVCSHVLEHMTKEEIEQTIINFKKIETNHYLITAIPTENWLSNVLSWIMRPIFGDSHEFHKTKINEIDNILKKYYIPMEKKDVWTMTITRKWAPLLDK